jgi:hypothetical protein
MEQSMIIVQITGGLGNQMFQYAYAKALEQRGYRVKLDKSELETYKIHGGYQLDKYNIGLECATEREVKAYFTTQFPFKLLDKLGLRTSNLIKEKSLLFDINLLNVKDDSYLSGYFQCERYFTNIRNLLLKEFCIKGELSFYTREIQDNIIKSTESCSIHIRRGDFISNKSNIIHGSCSLEYYLDSINYLQNNFEGLKYFIFSDDMSWAKENIQLENATYIESKERRIPNEDLFLMSLCDHNIIANSTFSWWGAWLNLNENKIVLAPKRWFANESLHMLSQDIVPEKWIRL